jgi:hypothetical protein
VVRFGFDAPRWSQLIWVDPRECDTFVSSHNRSYTGQVLPGDWDLHTLPLTEHSKIFACSRHWQDGLSWEETGIIDEIVHEVEKHGSKDGCRSREDVIERYRQLDLVFEQVRRESRMRTRRELDPDAYREVGGVYIHLGRDTKPIFGDAGCHRLAIARVLELTEIPAQLGVVHEAALETWKTKYVRG